MRDYLKEYGTFQQQKLAIAEEYAEKIRKAQSQGERLTLEKQRDAAVHKVDMESLTQKIDWGAAFGDLTGLLADQMKNLLGELKQYVKTDEFKKSGAADQQVVYDAIERIQSMLPGGNGTLDFARLQTQMHALGDAVTRVQNAELQQEAAFIRLKAAQADYNKALESGNQAEIERTQIALQTAQSSSVSADEEYLNATSEMKALAGEVKSASRDTVDGLNMVSNGLHGFASGTLQGSFEGIQNMLTGLSKLNIGGKVGDAISRMSETLSSAGVIGQIISAILSILDLLKDGVLARPCFILFHLISGSDLLGPYYKCMCPSQPSISATPASGLGNDCLNIIAQISEKARGNFSFFRVIFIRTVLWNFVLS